HAVYPHALVVLDAFSHPVGHDEASARWATTIERLRHVAAAIRERVGRPDQVLDLVGNSLREAVLWASITDAYLAPNGTAQHNVGWFSDAPGIIYGPPTLLDRPAEARQGAFEAEGRPIPITVVGTPVEAGALRYATDRRRHTENIRLDRDEVISTLLEL